MTDDQFFIVALMMFLTFSLMGITGICVVTVLRRIEDLMKKLVEEVKPRQ